MRAKTIIPEALFTNFVAALPLPAAAGWSIFLVASLFVLLKAADLFTEKAGFLGRAAGMSSFLIGVTIVAVGTSLPELVSSVLAVLRGADGIVLGNVIGSNIANLCLVLAIAPIIAGHVQIRRQLISLDLPFLVAATVLLTLVVLSGTVGRIEALILLFALGVFLHFTIFQPDHLKLNAAEQAAEEEAGDKDGSVLVGVVFLVLSAVFIFVSADIVVQSVIGAASTFGISTDTLAATVVALGTSLPEVAVTVSAARMGKAEMAIGNVLGSNIFNALAVTGVAALVAPIGVPPAMIAIGLPVMLASTAMTVFMLQAQYLSRWEGLLLILVYVHFILWIAGFLT